MADDDFSTGAELEISVSDSSLSEARDTIESELGNLEVDVNAVVSGNQRQPRDPSSGQFMAIEGMEQRQVDTTQTLENLIQIENERWELDKYRNDYLEQLADTGMMGGGGGGGGGGGTTILGGTGALASGATALGGLLATGVGIFGGREALASGVGGQTGRRVVSERRQLTGLSGIQMLQENPGKAMAQTFKTMLDPSGIGETLATNAAQGIMSKTQLDEQFSQGLDAAFGDLSEQSWPDIPDLRDQSWPQPPDLSRAFEWPDPPDLNPFDGGQGAGGQQSVRGRFERQMFGTDTQRPGGGGQAVEPQIDLGGITVDVTTTIEDAVDDAVDDVQDTVDQEVGELERRVSEALGGFF